jgi:cytoskeletal protein CcmA (bactofilin family)
VKSKDEINAFLGKNTAFEGKLEFSGTVRVDGRVKGEIVGEGTLIVGDSASIHADVRVTDLVISGEIRGSLFASEKVSIRSPGKVFGNIHAPTVIMEEGVIFEGHCRMLETAESGSEEATTST